MNTNLKKRAPAFWKVAPRVVWIQVHDHEQAKALSRIRGGRLVVRSVAGPYLRTFEFARSLRWAERWVARVAGEQLSRERGTNEGFSVLAAPLARGSAGRGCRQRSGLV